jgi:hypothetical protein
MSTCVVPEKFSVEAERELFEKMRIAERNFPFGGTNATCQKG